MPVAPVIRDALRSIAGGREQEVIYECRRCGSDLDGDATECPACGATDVATFTI